MSTIGVYVTWDGGAYVVRGDFDADAARVIARALERDGMEDEGAEWRVAADRADEIEAGR